MKRKTGSRIPGMRTSFSVAVALLALAACAPGGPPQGQATDRQQRPSLATPIGGGDDQRLRARENTARGSRPYSVPPERRRAQTPPATPSARQGAPLSAPMREQPVAAAAPATPEGQAEPASLRETTLTDHQHFDPETTSAPATSRPAPGDGSEASVPLVQVSDVSADGGPNVIAYALKTSHPVGTERYPRRNPLRWQVWERNCLQYGNQNAAQEAFLAAGGPERDRHNLDPVGDGYACWWDPEPIRQALGGS